MNQTKAILECISSIMKILPVISVGVGAITVAFYCLKIEFYPVGISISDTIFLIFIMLGLFITLIIGTLIGSLATLIILPIAAKIRTSFMGSSSENPFGEENHYKRIDRLTILTSSIFFMFFLYVITILSLSEQDLNEKLSNISLVISFIAGGIILTYSLHVRRKNADGSVLPLRKSKSNIAMVIGAFITPMIIGAPDKIIQFPFSYFGISDRNAVINIDTESWNMIKYAAQLSKIEPDTCQNGKDLIVLKNAEILWSKIGDRALLRVFGKDKHRDTPFIEVEIPSKGLLPIKVGNTQIECNL